MCRDAQLLSRRNLFRGKFTSHDDTHETGGWHRLNSPAVSARDVFWSGWADAAGAFVVGDDGVILDFDGAEWTRRAAPSPVPVHALWGRTREDLWAVGWMGMILHHDGSEWRHLRGCEVDEAGKYASVPANTPLFAITGREDGQAWAVGDRGTILHFDGADWTAEVTGTAAHLRGAARLPCGRILVAGGDGCVLLRGTEETSGWQRLDCPLRSNFTAVLPLDDGNVLLAGGRYFISENGFRGDLVLWDGSGFRTLFSESRFSRFRDLALCKHGVLAVGDGGQIHILRDPGGSTARAIRVDSGSGHDLLGLVSLPSGETLAVGDFGTVLAGDTAAPDAAAPYVAARNAPALWDAMPSGTDRQLWGMWSDPATLDTYACGEDGTVLLLDRGQWESLPPCGGLGIHALNRAPDGGVLAVGQLGEIHHFDGQCWRKEFDLHMDITLLSLWSDGAGHFVAAGDEGLALGRAGQSWERMTTGTRSALYGLWGVDADHLLAVGDFGLVLRWNGRRWDEFSAGTEHFLFDVWGRGLDDVYVVGLSGTIGHFDGKRWRITPARARADLLAVTGDARQVVAVGVAGTALCNRGDGWAIEPTGTSAGLRATARGPEGDFLAAGDQGTILRQRSESSIGAIEGLSDPGAV